MASRRLADVDLGVEACFTFAEIQIFPPKGEFRYADSAKLAFHARLERSIDDHPSSSIAAAERVVIELTAHPRRRHPECSVDGSSHPPPVRLCLTTPANPRLLPFPADAMPPKLSARNQSCIRSVAQFPANLILDSATCLRGLSLKSTVRP